MVMIYARQFVQKTSTIPVLMLTHMSALNDKIEGYESGADDYMVKPFEFKELAVKNKSHCLNVQ